MSPVRNSDQHKRLADIFSKMKGSTQQRLMSAKRMEADIIRRWLEPPLIANDRLRQREVTSVATM